MTLIFGSRGRFSVENQKNTSLLSVEWKNSLLLFPRRKRKKALKIKEKPLTKARKYGILSVEIDKTTSECP
jgi:hypothetical protein